jgi:acyl transferase domain-containing protein/acyl carrier protein
MSETHARSIAIVGIGCRFPGGVDTPESFRRMLIEGRQAVGDIPPDRVDLKRFYGSARQTPGKMHTRFGGYLSDIDQFDAEFFDMAPRDAERLDPQHRLLLETAWEALEDAGLYPAAMEGGRVGVFVGQWLADFEQRLFAHPEELDFSMTLGSGRYAASGRISYAFNFTGPSITLDTACSSSLSAVHMAVQSLRSGESSLALAGGVNIILGPHIYVAYSQSGMMAGDGRCKFGDARADGYVRSEGAGVIVLKRLDDALRDRDRIHAVIRGTAVNNDGRSSGSMGTPSLKGQQDLLRRALADAGAAPLDIDYVEAHGTGTRAGDKVEIGALAAVLGEGRLASKPLRVGSVKTNIGHTESAAGMAGLIKTVFAVRDGEIPPTLNFETPSPDVPWDAAPLELPRGVTAWHTDQRPRRAGVSGFGISGANAHAIVEQPPEPAGADEGCFVPIPLLPLSARSEAALRSLAGRLAERLTTAESPMLTDILRFAQTRRAGFEHRAAFLAVDRSDLVSGLKAYAAGGEAMARGVADPRRETTVAVVFPGQGGQWCGMGRALMAQEPVFRESIEGTDAVIRRETGWSLLEQLALNPGDPGYRGDSIDVLQPTLGALSIAYAAWMKAFGLAVDFAVGHSMGEAAAAHVAGALSLDDALRVLCRRSALMRRLSGAGAMALVELSAEDVGTELAGLDDRVSIAAVNSARSTVISGDKACVTDLVAGFNARGIFSRAINVDVASHCPQMEAPSRALRDELDGILPQIATTPFASALFGLMVPGEDLNATYWARNLREPVQFAKALDALAERGVGAFLEVGPHPVLGPSIEQWGADSGRGVTVACCGRREEDERARLIGALAALWCAGAKVDFARGATSPAPVIDFPHYPWARRRLWVDVADISRTNAAAAVEPPGAEARDWMFQTLWRELPTAPTSRAVHDEWLLIGDAALARPLEDLGASVEVAPLTELHARLSTLSGETVRNVLIVAPQGEAAAFLPLRAAQAASQGVPSRLWFATQDAQSPNGCQRLDIDHAALSGAARVLADERPDLWGGVLDLSSTADADDMRAAAAWLIDPRSEDLAAVRGGRIYVPRLTPVTDTQGARLGWRADGAYLLTGGLGGVGLAVARSMVEEGARRLILMSRQGLPPRRTWADIDPASPVGERIAALRALESLGASIHCPAVDVSDEAAVAAFLAEYAAEGWPPIRGIVHLAVVVERGLIGDTNQAQFEAAIAGKLRGAQTLDRLLPDLDCFVLFSSTRTILPQAGIAAYVAANAGLEALAFDRRARGVPAIAIAWGQWRVGLGQAVIADQTQLGAGSFTTERGANLFSWVAAQPNPVIAVVPVDWRVYSQARAGRNEPLLNEVKRSAGALARDAGVLTGATTVDDVLVVVRESVARVMGFRIDEIDPNKEFGAMGLTSLLALELRNQLERVLARPLSATLAWNYPTVASLAAHLSDADRPRPGPPKLQPPPARTAETLAAKVAAVSGLSDTDALLALRRRRKEVLS